MTWSVKLDEPPGAPLLIVGDLLLVPTQKADRQLQCTRLYAYSQADGGSRWLRSFEHTQVSGLTSAPVPAISEVSVLITLDSTDLQHCQGALLALDSTGEVRWQWIASRLRISAPAVSEDVVCVTAGTRTFFTIDINNGQVCTRVGLGADASFSASALANGVAYVPCRGPHLLAVGLDGQIRWQFDMHAPSDIWLNQTPVVVGEQVVAVASSGSILALRAQDGARIWQVDVGPSGKSLSPPATDGERVYVGAADGLYAFDLEDGHQLWTFTTDRSIEAAPVIVAGVVYAACHDHHIYAFDAISGRKLWQHEAGQRRIEVSPVVTTAAAAGGAHVFVADRGGLLVAIARPLSAAEHEAAGNWLEAASAYAELGQAAHGAQLLEDHDEPFKAAELWKAAGELERAAIQYEQAGEWQRAAELWEESNQPLRKAKALEQYARSLNEETCSPKDQAAAWAAAADVFEAEGERDRVFACQREVAKHLQQPFITVDVQHEGLVIDDWTRIQFIAQNEGRGAAHSLIIRVKGEQFEGQVAGTREIATLKPGRQKSEWLDVRPRQHGRSVPMRVVVEYKDDTENVHICEHVIYLYVAEPGRNGRASSDYHAQRSKTGSGKELDSDSTGAGEMIASSPFTSGYALLIGVGADLPVTVQDATALYNILTNPRRCAYPSDQVRLLTEAQTTRQDILNGLDWLIARTKNDPDATAVVYFSGHGGRMPDYHLVPYGYDVQALSDTAVSGAEFTERLRAIESKKLLILLDCCHAGGMTEAKAPGFVKAPVPPELSSILTVGSGRVLIASSRKNELSYTSTPHSVFTQALREGLAGYGAAERDGYAYVADVAMYVGRMVPNRTNDRQHPILKLAAADNFAIAYYAGGEKSPKPLTEAHSYIPPVEAVDIDVIDRYRRILKKYQGNLLDVEERIAQFYDQAAVPLDLERTKEGILQKITEIEAKIEQEAKTSGWTPPSVAPTTPTLEDVVRRLDEMRLSLGRELDDLKQGQIAIYRCINVQDQAALETILAEVQQQRIEQGAVKNALDAIRRTLKYIQETGLPVDDPAIRQSLDDIYQVVNSDLSLRQQLELSLPVIPFLLEYKVGLDAGVDLGAVWKELVERIRK